MSWVAVAVVGGSVIGAGASIYGSDKAASAAQRGANAATGESARQFDLIRSDTAPLRSIQGSALDTLASLYGWAPPSQAMTRETSAQPVLVGDTNLPPGTYTNPVGNGWYAVYAANGDYIGNLRPGGRNGRFTPTEGLDLQPYWDAAQQTTEQAAAPGRPSMDAFFESPDFQFNLEEGQKAIDRSAAARGRALSGASVREGVRYASGLASREFGNFTNRLLAAAGLGTTGVTTSANAGIATAGQIGAAQQNAGQARASAYMTGAQGVNNAVQSGLSNYLLTQYLKPTQAPLSTPPYAGDPYGYYGGGGVRLS